MKKSYEIDLDRAIARLCTASGKVKSTKNDPYYEQLLQSAREVVFLYRNYINLKEKEYFDLNSLPSIDECTFIITVRKKEK